MIIFKESITMCGVVKPLRVECGTVGRMRPFDVRFSIAAFVKSNLTPFRFLSRSVQLWQIASQGLVLLFEVGTWPPHDGVRRMGWFNHWSVLADDGRQGLRTSRTHLIRRPRGDTFLPEQNPLNSLSALSTVHAA
jgi:hypothetical protein